MNLSTDITQTINFAALWTLRCSFCCVCVHQNYLWQSILGQLHGVECVSFIRHVMDRLAPYWNLGKQWRANSAHNIWLFTILGQRISNRLNPCFCFQLPRSNLCQYCRTTHGNFNFASVNGFIQLMNDTAVHEDAIKFCKCTAFNDLLMKPDLWVKNK